MAGPPRSVEVDSDYFRLVADNADDAIVCASHEGTITYGNEAAAGMFGYAPEELTGRPLSTLVPVEVESLRPKKDQGGGDGRRLGPPVEVEGQRKDGSRFPVTLAIGHAFVGDDTVFIGILRDASTRMEGDLAMARSEERYRTLFEDNPQAMWVFDAETLHFLAVNEAAVDDYGYTREEFLGMTLKDIRPPDELPRFNEPVSRLPSLSGRTTWRHRKKDGAIIDVEIRSHQVTFEGRRARLVIAQDVTARNRAEQALRESERRFRELLENMSLVAVVLDLQGRVTFCNDYLAQLVGYTKDELVGASWFERCIPSDESTAMAERFQFHVSIDGIAAHHQNDIVTRTGERRTIDWNNTMLRDPEGCVVGTASIGIDITDEMRAKQRLVHDALHDGLTGLPNRLLFLDRLSVARARAARNGGEDGAYAVLLMDLDRFKLVNDGLGHAVGDQLLVAASAAIRRCVREGDTVARLGGDEFAILLEGVHGAEDATRTPRCTARNRSAPRGTWSSRDRCACARCASSRWRPICGARWRGTSCSSTTSRSSCSTPEGCSGSRR